MKRRKSNKVTTRNSKVDKKLAEKDSTESAGWSDSTRLFHFIDELRGIMFYTYISLFEKMKNF